MPTRTPRGEEVRWWERPMPPETRDAEAWEMCRELMRVLHATGRYSATGLSEACDAIGRPHARETISRVLNGKQPPSYGLVEDLAMAAGVDLAFLYPAA
ncbi:MAG: helix-turn-helix domain-containing protein [Actinomycetes bacterium]